MLVDRPDWQGRHEILKVHVRKVKLAPDVDLENIARRTPGFSGADLANVVDVLVPPVDRVAGSRVRGDVVDAVDEVLSRTQAESMLELGRPALRLVDDRLATAEQVGPIEAQAVVVAGVAHVQEHLAEQPADPRALLDALVRPVLGKRGPVGARVFEGAADSGEAVGRDVFGILVRAEVDPRFADLTDREMRLPVRRLGRGA